MNSNHPGHWCITCPQWVNTCTRLHNDICTYNEHNSAKFYIIVVNSKGGLPLFYICTWLYELLNRLRSMQHTHVDRLKIIGQSVSWQLYQKIHEDLMNDQLYAYFEDIFEELLSAFRKKYSCQSLLTKLINDWKISLDSNQVVGAVFMDLSKAFDCLPHSLIIAKLHAYGLSLDACKFLSSYSSGRHQRVKIQNDRSNWKLISKGVPQGSILGPILFNTFMNDMFLFIEHCNLYNYADDNSMSASAESIDEVMALLKADCENAVSWFTSNGMKANPGKFQYMIVSPHDVTDKKLELLVNGVVLKPESSVKVLGITIDSRLKFSQHVSNLCTKAARQLMPLLAFPGTSMKLLDIWFTTPLSEVISISALWFGIFVEYRIMENLKGSKSVL